MKWKRYAPMIFTASGTIAMVFIENTAFAYRGQSCWWGFGSGYMGGWGMGGFGPLSMLLFWGLLITGAILLIRWAIQSFRKASSISPEMHPVRLTSSRRDMPEEKSTRRNSNECSRHWAGLLNKGPLRAFQWIRSRQKPLKELSHNG